MDIYFSLYIIIILLHLLPSESERIVNFKLKFTFLLIFIFIAIRVDFGGDYQSYIRIFEFNKEYYKPFESIDLFTGPERGYAFLNYILPSHRALLVVLSVFTCYTYYWVFKNYIPKKYYFHAFSLMMIFNNMLLFFQIGALRNAVAVNILILSTPFIIKRKLLPYILSIIVAFLFHRSAVLYMPIIYFIATPNEFKRSDIKKWTIAGVLILTVSTSSLLSIISPLIDTYFIKYQGYLEHATEYELSATSKILLTGFVAIMLILSLIVLSKTRLNKTETVVFKMSLLYSLVNGLGTLNVRASQYFAIFFLLAAIIVINRVKDPLLKLSYLGALLLYLTFSFFIGWMGNPHFDLVFKTYHTIFN